MSRRTARRIPRTLRRLALGAGLAVGGLLLAGCAPAYSTRPAGYYGGQTRYQGGDQRCYQGCGYVRDIREVSLGGGNNSDATVGTVIGAIAGGLLGHTVGKGDGRTAATVAGAVGGGFAGHAVGSRAGDHGDYGWQVVVELQNGRTATVTQRNPPQARVGDYVMIRDNQVYRY